jgi:hypothetical protein
MYPLQKSLRLDKGNMVVYQLVKERPTTAAAPIATVILYVLAVASVSETSSNALLVLLRVLYLHNSYTYRCSMLRLMLLLFLRSSSLVQ